MTEREHIAAAADRVAEDFMERYRRRPYGSGDGLYDIADAFSSFADALRNPPGPTTPDPGPVQGT